MMRWMTSCVRNELSAALQKMSVYLRKNDTEPRGRVAIFAAPNTH